MKGHRRPKGRRKSAAKQPQTQRFPVSHTHTHTNAHFSDRTKLNCVCVGLSVSLSSPCGVIKAGAPPKEIPPLIHSSFPLFLLTRSPFHKLEKNQKHHIYYMNSAQAIALHWLELEWQIKFGCLVSIIPLLPPHTHARTHSPRWLQCSRGLDHSIMGDSMGALAIL